MAMSQKTQRDLMMVGVLACILTAVGVWLLNALGIVRFGSSPAPAKRTSQGLASSAPSEPKTAVPTPSQPPRARTPQGTEEVATTAAIVSQYHAAELRDPMKSWLPEQTPPVVSSTATPGPTQVTKAPAVVQPKFAATIEGIVWGGPHAMVIIDHDVYRIGDVVRGAVITRIRPEGVRLTLQGRTIDIPMNAPVDPSIAPSAPSTAPASAVMGARRPQSQISPIGGTQ